ncbi:MAG: hypothetical protein ABJN40_03300 [Sneathiella sp.]
MPLVQVTAPEGALSKDQQDRFMSHLSNAVLKAEKAPVNDEGAQSLIWAYYDTLPVGDIYIGGTNMQAPPLRINITTPAGALNTQARSELVAAVGQLVDDLIGPYDGRLNHWTMLHEVAEGSWAGAGQIFSLADIQTAMNIKAA